MVGRAPANHHGAVDRSGLCRQGHSLRHCPGANGGIFRCRNRQQRLTRAPLEPGRARDRVHRHGRTLERRIRATWAITSIACPRKAARSRRSSAPLRATMRRRRSAPDGKALYFKYAAAGCRGLSPGAAAEGRLARGRRRHAGDPRLRSRYCALCADAGRQARLPPRAGRRQGESLSGVDARAEAGAGARACRRRLHRSAKFRQKAAKPALIASYGSSVSPAEIVRIDPARTIARQSHPCRYGGGRGDRLAAAAALLFHQRQGPKHPQHDRAAAGVRSRQESIPCWCSFTAVRRATTRIRSDCAGTITCWPRPAT